MNEKVIIEDGIVVPVPQRIKSVCKKRRDSMHISNQQISDGILENFGIDIPIGTINNFFAERTKASSVYTTGYICAYLGVSLDEQFGIIPPEDPEERLSVAVLQERVLNRDKEILSLKEHRDEMIDEMRRRRPIIYSCLLAVIIMSVVLFWYVATDISNPHIGFFQHTGGSPIIGAIVIIVSLTAVCTAFTSFFITKKKKK